MDKEDHFIFKESRQITLLIGHYANSEHAVYAYMDYSPEMIKKLREDNPNWLQEELSKYQLIYTSGATILRSRKPRKYQGSEQKDQSVG